MTKIPTREWLLGYIRGYYESLSLDQQVYFSINTGVIKRYCRASLYKLYQEIAGE